MVEGARFIKKKENLWDVPWYISKIFVYYFNDGAITLRCIVLVQVTTELETRYFVYKFFCTVRSTTKITRRFSYLVPVDRPYTKETGQREVKKKNML